MAKSKQREEDEKAGKYPTFYIATQLAKEVQQNVHPFSKEL